MKVTGGDLDLDALQRKYREERNKRLRSDGMDQFRDAEGSLSRFAEDPWIESAIERAPLAEESDAVIVGGGWAGLLTAVRLRQAGIGGFRIIEKGGDFGGAWYWNRYPGAACDTESYIYMPLLEELGYVPKEKYSQRLEIFAHARRIGQSFDLYENALFQTAVTQANWDENERRWIVRTNRDDCIKARFLVTACGLLDKMRLPGIRGIELFKGASFHASRWDYGYTGSLESGLARLADKRIGIIGTGATAIQCVPHLGAAAKHLYVFQRTPSSISPRNNQPTDPAWASSLPTGWQKQRIDNFNHWASGIAQAQDLVNDGWTDIARRVWVNPLPDDPTSPEAQRLLFLADIEKMEQVRKRVDAIVKDTLTANALKPYYNVMCKRPCFHDEYLATFNLPNVTLVDTNGRGVEEVTASGVIAGGKEYALDCMIFATGFEFVTNSMRQPGFDVRGRGGRPLADKWRDGASTFHGFHVNGFPNFFIISLMQSAVSVNIVPVITEQAKHVAYIIEKCKKDRIETVEATVGAESEWVRTIVELGKYTEEYFRNCTPGVMNHEGNFSELARRNSYYGGGAVQFAKILEDWRAAGTLRGLETLESAD